MNQIKVDIALKGLHCVDMANNGKKAGDNDVRAKIRALAAGVVNKRTHVGARGKTIREAQPLGSHNPGNRKTAAQLIALGCTTTELCQIFDVGSQTVRTFKNKAEIKAMIAEQSAAFASLVPDVIILAKRTIEESKASPVAFGSIKGFGAVQERTANIKLRELANKIGDRTLQTVGILPAQGSVTLNQFVLNDSAGLSPLLVALLKSSIPELLNPTVDITPSGDA